MSKLNIDESVKNVEIFLENLNSEMYYKSEISSDSMSFLWLDQVEFACPYIDEIIRNPRLFLITEEEIVKIEKAKKIGVESIKNLSKNTHFIDKIDEVTNEVQPSKILIERKEETFNTYENRFVYTLIDHLVRFVHEKELVLDEFEVKKDKILEYKASTDTKFERVNVELKISTDELPEGKTEADFLNEMNEIRRRINRVKEFFAAWSKSEFLTFLKKTRAIFVRPPIRKTNMILKNPNFQVAMKLWTFLQLEEEKNNDFKSNVETSGNEILKGIMDDAFLMNYFVLDSISSYKREQKKKLNQYAMVIFKQQIKRTVEILLNSGIDISDEEIVSMISSEIKNEKIIREVGCAEIKDKFKCALDEYLEQTKDYF